MSAGKQTLLKYSIVKLGESSNCQLFSLGQLHTLLIYNLRVPLDISLISYARMVLDSI